MMTPTQYQALADRAGAVTALLAILAFVVSLALQGSVLWLAIAAMISVLGCSVVLWAESRADEMTFIVDDE